MRPYSELRFGNCGDSSPKPKPDPSKAVAAEILLRHRNEVKSPSLLGVLSSLLSKLRRAIPPKAEPPQWPLAGVRQPLGRGPGPRSGAVAMKEPR